MSRVFSLAQHTTPLWTPPEMIYNAFHLGYDTVAVRSIRQGVAGEVAFDFVKDRQLFKATKEAIRETGIGIHDVDLVAIYSDTDIGRYEPELGAAAELGCKGVVSSVWTEDREHYTAQFKALCDLASGFGLEVYLEFVTWSDLKDLRAAHKLVEETGLPNAKILLDTIHWYRSRNTLQDIEDCPMESFGLIHICDAPEAIPSTQEELIVSGRTQRFYPGDGGVDIAGVVRRIDENIVIGIEIPNKDSVEKYGAFEHAHRCLSATKRYLGEAGIVVA